MHGSKIKMLLGMVDVDVACDGSRTKNISIMCTLSHAWDGVHMLMFLS